MPNSSYHFFSRYAFKLASVATSLFIVCLMIGSMTLARPFGSKCKLNFKRVEFPAGEGVQAPVIGAVAGPPPFLVGQVGQRGPVVVVCEDS